MNILVDDIKKLIRKLAIPAFIGTLFQTLYNVVRVILSLLVKSLQRLFSFKQIFSCIFHNYCNIDWGNSSGNFINR